MAFILSQALEVFRSFPGTDLLCWLPHKTCHLLRLLNSSVYLTSSADNVCSAHNECLQEEMFVVIKRYKNLSYLSSQRTRLLAKSLHHVNFLTAMNIQIFLCMFTLWLHLPAWYKTTWKSATLSSLPYVLRNSEHLMKAIAQTRIDLVLYGNSTVMTQCRYFFSGLNTVFLEFSFSSWELWSSEWCQSNFIESNS